MEKKVKKATEKTQNIANKSINKITSTAKNINEQVSDTVETVVEDVMANGKEIRMVATKSVKEAAKKVKLTKSANKIKATAQKVNAQIQETITEVLDDVKANSQEMQANATKMAMEAIENLHITERADAIKNAVKNVNETSLETAEELVDGIMTTTEKWQNIAAKAVKNGFYLAERQQNIVFSALESVKGQLGGNAMRLKNIFKNNNN